MSNHGVLIITPTDKRDVRVIERCVRSVDSQTYAGRVLHVVCSDGPEDPRVRDWIQARGKEGLSYRATGVRTNSCGAGVRDWVLRNVARGDPSIAYIAHLDDDNVMLPHYLEANISALEA